MTNNFTESWLNVTFERTNTDEAARSEKREASSGHRTAGGIPALAIVSSSTLANFSMST